MEQIYYKNIKGELQEFKYDETNQWSAVGYKVHILNNYSDFKN